MKAEQNTYKDFVLKKIKGAPLGEPIYISEVAKAMSEHFSISIEHAAAATSVAIKRIIDGKDMDDLRIFKKGIYYVTKVTPFGEAGINKERLIFDKYLQDGKGYIGGLMGLYQMGLTTQIPKTKELVTNAAKDCLRKDKDLGVSIRPPKTTITDENIEYLKALDAMDLMDRAPIDAEEPYRILADYINDKSLNYRTMLALADKYYPKNTIIKLARVAGAGGVM